MGSWDVRLLNASYKEEGEGVVVGPVHWRFTDAMVLDALRRTEIDGTPMNWSEDDILKLADNLRKVGKPMIVAANKCDIAPDGNIKKL